MTIHTEGWAGVSHRGLEIGVMVISDGFGISYVEGARGGVTLQCSITWNTGSGQWVLQRKYPDVTVYDGLKEAHEAALDYIADRRDIEIQKAGSVEEIKVRKAVSDLISSLEEGQDD